MVVLSSIQYPVSSNEQRATSNEQPAVILKHLDAAAMERNAPEVLIVEDSEEMLWAMGNVLEKAGFSIDAVTTGGDAIETVKKFPDIKLIILNFLLPDRSGLTVMKQLRANGCKAEVIGISTLRGIEQSFMKGGAFAFLEKPFDIRELVDVCKQALNKRNEVADIPQ